MSVRILPEPNDGQGRVETGSLQVGDDWPGLFIRGDNAFHLAMQIDHVLHFLLNGVSDKDKVEKGGIELALAVGELTSIRDMIRGDVIVGGWPPGGAKVEGDGPK